jgi:hypothetical protein
MVIPVLVTADGIAHVALLVNRKVTTSPLLNVEVVNVLDVSPKTSAPLILHWYAGVVPPLVIVELKVTDVLGQTVEPGFAVMLTVGTTEGVTSITITLLVALAGTGHVALLVKITRT